MTIMPKICLVLITMLMLVYGGRKHVHKNIYDENDFYNLKSIKSYEKQLKYQVRTDKMVDIKNKIDIQEIANLEYIYVMNLKDKQSIHMFDYNNHIIVLINHDRLNLHFLKNNKLIKKTSDVYSIINCCVIKNVDSHTAKLTLVVVKKPY